MNDRNTINYGSFIGIIVDKLYLEENKINFKSKEINEIKIYKKDDKEDENVYNTDNKNINEKEIEKNDDKEEKIIINKKDEKLKNNENKIINDDEDNKEQMNVIINEEKKINCKGDERIINNENEYINKDHDKNLSKNEDKKNDNKEKEKNINFDFESNDIELIGYLINSPFGRNLIKNMIHDPNLLKKLENAFGLNGLIEQNQITKETLENSYWVENFCTPEVLKNYLKILFGIDLDNKKNNQMNEMTNNINIVNQQSKKNNLNNMNNNFNIFGIGLNNNNEINLLNPKVKNNIKINQMNIKNKYDINLNYKDQFIKLKNMGFENDNLIHEALFVCQGNLEASIEFLTRNDDFEEDKK